MAREKELWWNGKAKGRSKDRITKWRTSGITLWMESSSNLNNSNVAFASSFETLFLHLNVACPMCLIYENHLPLTLCRSCCCCYWFSLKNLCQHRHWGPRSKLLSITLLINFFVSTNRIECLDFVLLLFVPNITLTWVPGELDAHVCFLSRETVCTCVLLFLSFCLCAVRSSGDAGDDAAVPRACNVRCSCGLMMVYHRFVDVVV